MKQLTLKGRLVLFLSLLIVFSTLISSFFYQRIHKDNAYRQLSQLSMQSLASTAAAIEEKLSYINTFSKIILSNQDVQNLLRNNNAADQVEYMRRTNRFLKELMTNDSKIDTVHILDNQLNEYYNDRVITSSYRHVMSVNYDRHSRWNEDTNTRAGGAIYRLNGDDFYIYNSRKPFVSHMRVINDLELQIKLGVLILNVSPQVFSDAYHGLDISEDTTIVLLDRNYISICGTELQPSELEQLIGTFSGSETGTELVNFRNQTHLVSYLKMPETEWYLLSLTLLESSILQQDGYRLVFTGLLLNGAIIFLGAIIISRSITTPIAYMAHAMSLAEKGQLQIANVHTSVPELEKLRNGYNTMILEIQKLFERVVREERFKRKAELNALQAQVKPHFLYNTFDSISALAIMGKNQRIIEMVRALSSFYRNSLSNSDEMIKVSDEVELIRNYLSIQNIRYENVFEVHFEIEDETEDLLVLKLLLQPLVENALYHGIKPSDRKGRILIKIWKETDNLIMMVEDNGVGMKQEVIDSLLKSDTTHHIKSFGLRGTVERLRIYYNIYNILSINSTPEKGTQIIIKIPLERSDGLYDY